MIKVVKNITDMQKISLEHKLKGDKIAVVPTMGFLHEGHLSLIRKAREFTESVVTTLFVNPSQFGPNEDYNRYPRNFERDLDLCNQAGSKYLFNPEVLDMYPKGFNTSIKISGVTDKFEGEFRPGHFDGVATVVAKLFNSTLPDYAVFGQKDYQQTLLIKKLTKDLNFPIEIVIAPTIREIDGLAMSSRNTYLDIEIRKKAGVLFYALNEARKIISEGETNRLRINTSLHKALRTIPEIKIDYAASALADTLDEPESFFPGDSVVILIAAYLGKTRLIDNEIVKIPYKLNEENFIIT
ncbi:pantoate--beta-alanine ligase [Candidatus Kapaibacterium sp.]